MNAKKVELQRKFMQEQGISQRGKIWDSLTKVQKKEVLLSYKDSEKDENLKSWEEIKKKY